MSAQAQMRAMLDQLMGTGRDGELNWLWLRSASDPIKTGVCVVASISREANQSSQTVRHALQPKLANMRIASRLATCCF